VDGGEEKPPRTATSGRFGRCMIAVRVLTLGCMSRTGSAGKAMSDSLGAGVSAVAGSEGVVDLHVRQLGHARDQFRVVMSLAGLVTNVLNHQSSPGASRSLSFRTAAPMTAGANFTGAPISSANRSAAGRIDRAGRDRRVGQGGRPAPIARRGRATLRWWAASRGCGSPLRRGV
jgi:hypothetical protein